MIAVAISNRSVIHTLDAPSLVSVDSTLHRHFSKSICQCLPDNGASIGSEYLFVLLSGQPEPFSNNASGLFDNGIFLLVGAETDFKIVHPLLASLNLQHNHAIDSQ